MGVECCAAEADNTITVVPETMTDLPAVDTTFISDPIEKFEMSLPFSRTLLQVMQ